MRLPLIQARRGFFLGIAVAVVGVLVAIAAVLLTIRDTKTLLMTLGVIVLAVVSVIFAIKPHMKTLMSLFFPRQMKDGRTTIGKIISVQQTGTYINRQPECAIQVSFETADGRKITSVANATLPLTALAQFQPGAPIPVRYEAADPQSMVIDLEAEPAVLQKAFNQLRIKQGLATEEGIEVAEKGIRAQGVVLSMVPTGKILEGHAELRLQMKVTKPEGGVFEASITKFVPPQLLPKLQPGNVVEVAYMPGDEQNLVLRMSLG